MTGRTTRAGALLVLAVLLAGCGASDQGAGAEPQQLTVLAAASLTESFQAIGTRFEEESGADVRFSFGSSATLATQVNDGAPADVYASANEETMQTVVDAGRADGEPEIFVTNTLQIAVPAGNPAGITGLDDFADPEHTVVLCAEQVPCGAAAQRLLDTAGIIAKPDSYERDVKAALRKVEQNEADAALVYATDVASAADRVEGIEIDGVDQTPNRYPIVTLTDAAAPQLAGEFVDSVQSEAGRKVLNDAGFGSP